MALPLTEIVTLANVLAEVSGKLYDTYRKRRKPALPDQKADADTQLAALREHVQQLESIQEKQTELAMQISAQMQELTEAVAGQAYRLRVVLALALLSMGISVGGLVVFLT